MSTPQRGPRRPPSTGPVTAPRLSPPVPPELLTLRSDHTAYVTFVTLLYLKIKKEAS